MSNQSLIDAGQVIKSSYDETNKALRVVGTSTSFLPKVSYDYVTIELTSAVKDTIIYKDGGDAGTVVGIITIEYTDGTREAISNIVKVL